MVTTRRSSVGMNNSFENATNKGGVGLLERNETSLQQEVEVSSNAQAERLSNLQTNRYLLLFRYHFTQQMMKKEVRLCLLTESITLKSFLMPAETITE